jgi:hypothetical protein
LPRSLSAAANNVAAIEWPAFTFFIELFFLSGFLPFGTTQSPDREFSIDQNFIVNHWLMPSYDTRQTNCKGADEAWN